MPDVTSMMLADSKVLEARLAALEAKLDYLIDLLSPEPDLVWRVEVSNRYVMTDVYYLREGYDFKSQKHSPQVVSNFTSNIEKAAVFDTKEEAEQVLKIVILEGLPSNYKAQLWKGLK
jgi:hypothetical protein